MSQTTTHSEVSLFAPQIVWPAVGQAFRKLNPKSLVRNPVIFTTALVSVYSTFRVVNEAFNHGPHFWVGLQITIWLWFTVLFANFAEAVAEGRGKARADAFRSTKSDALAKVLVTADNHELFSMRPADELAPGTLIYVSVGEIIPTDAEVIEGVASIDESAITGESAPVIRESGGDRSSVTGGTRIVSDLSLIHI